MDFTLTTEQKDIQKAAREFAVGELSKVGREFDLNETFPEKILNKARQLDLIGLFLTEHIPRGGTFRDVAEEIRRQGGVVYVPHPFD